MEFKNNGLGQQQEKTVILRKKLALLKEFYYLTNSLQRTLSSENIEEFNDILEERKKLIESINSLDKELLLNEKQIPTPYNANEIPNNEIKELEINIKVYLMQIRGIDQKVQHDLKQNYNNIIKALDTMRVNRLAVASYYKKNNQPPAFFVDKKK
ncbi:hypothetical protein [Desulfoscipio gibsoniae]|uniref:FlgN protein n=1 Tax=Desulfoscipio gibsoniae DSM 7213 TaxID=767817 RepID=R4KGE2_9FIRM|nr:hypothetical protein [Desulfoscipio gibsoniae]AGL01664.1 FlgN protein [Desulfoscipio gibsoniae DSM 7213]